MSPRYLIVNADDFGQSPGINRGVIQAYEKGILTSASLMVRWPAAAEAAGYARRNPDLGVGLHLDFGEWIYRDGKWLPLYRVVDESDPRAVRAEIRRQLTLVLKFARPATSRASTTENEITSSSQSWLKPSGPVRSLS